MSTWEPAPGGEEISTPFLTARWENLVFLNYDCPSELLAPFVPAGTELDLWRGSHVVSLVGFHFVDTKLRGIPVPGHRTFEEVNLRFYVRRTAPDGETRRGVVFVRELVPRRAIAAVARLLYHEPYSALPMSHRIDVDAERGGSIEYRWRHRSGRHRITAAVSGPGREPAAGSEAEFITEHYWGYTRQRDGGTVEYRVEHRPWRVREATDFAYRAPPASGVYAPGFTAILSGAPRSAFVAEGGEVAVFPGRRIG